MSVHELNIKTRKFLHRKIGLTYEQLLRMSAEEIDAFIEERIEKKLTPSIFRKHFVNRGSVYLFFLKLMPISDVDKRLSKI